MYRRTGITLTVGRWGGVGRRIWPAVRTHFYVGLSLASRKVKQRGAQSGERERESEKIFERERSTRRTRRLKIEAQRRLGLKIAGDALRTPETRTHGLKPKRRRGAATAPCYCPAREQHSPPSHTKPPPSTPFDSGDATGAHLPLVPTLPLTTLKRRSSKRYPSGTVSVNREEAVPFPLTRLLSKKEREKNYPLKHLEDDDSLGGRKKRKFNYSYDNPPGSLRLTGKNVGQHLHKGVN